MPRIRHPDIWVLTLALLLVVVVYSQGLSGSWLFDDYPNIVDNQGVQPVDASIPQLVRAALSSPASDLKRPLASLSFAANYLASGLDPYSWKLTNLVIHLLNGILVFLLSSALMQCIPAGVHPQATRLPRSHEGSGPLAGSCTGLVEHQAQQRIRIVAALIAAGWMLLPINLTAVLYVVQRMESMANLFVLLGLLGYIAGRQRMLAQPADGASSAVGGLLLCVASLMACTGIGVLAKETAVMLPLYAFLTEWMIFGFRARTGRRDKRLASLFVVLLVLPMIVGLAWLLPQVLNPDHWSTRNFDLRTRLLSEARIVVAYIRWTLLPTPDALSFYHDDFRISQGLVSPWTTLASIGLLGILVALVPRLRKRQPLTALGIALFLGCQLLTGTILPLELVYEHRNYFASFGLLLAIIPWLATPRTAFFALPRHALLLGLMMCWTALTAFTAHAWGNPLNLAEDLANRAPQSPRAQYELGRTYIIYSHYNPDSPFTQLAYAPLEASAKLPNSSILPEQALIFMNSRMRLPIKDAWWNSLIAKLTAKRAGVQDESSLGALTQCARDQRCDLSKQRMTQAYQAALSHSDPSARLLAMYGDYAWNVLENHTLGERMMADAVKTMPNEPAYQITWIRMLVAQGRTAEARKVFHGLQALDIGGNLDSRLKELQALPGME